MEEKNSVFIEQSILDLLPAMVKAELVNLNEKQQHAFSEEFKRKKKSVGMAYFFLLLCFGAPYAYLGKWGWQIVYWITGMGFFIWFIILLFKLSSMVKDYNKDVAIETMRNIKTIS